MLTVQIWIAAGTLVAQTPVEIASAGRCVSAQACPSDRELISAVNSYHFNAAAAVAGGLATGAIFSPRGR
jgi:hypothetical protein